MLLLRTGNRSDPKLCYVVVYTILFAAAAVTQFFQQQSEGSICCSLMCFTTNECKIQVNKNVE